MSPFRSFFVFLLALLTLIPTPVWPQEQRETTGLGLVDAVVLEEMGGGGGARESKAEEKVETIQDSGPPGEILYSFLQAFPRAQAQRRRRGKNVRAWWLERGFQFEDSAAGAIDIFVSEDAVAGAVVRQAIAFNLVAGEESELIYSEVPPGRRIHLYFALPDGSFPLTRAGAPVLFEVLIGTKSIFEAELSTRGWKEKTIDLTLPFLLQRSYRLTFRVRTVDKQWKTFVFHGYVE